LYKWNDGIKTSTGKMGELAKLLYKWSDGVKVSTSKMKEHPVIDFMGAVRA